MNEQIKKAEESEKLADHGHFGLYAIKLPSGIWTFAGSIPQKLLIKKNGPYGDYWESPKCSTKQQVIDYYNKKK